MTSITTRAGKGSPLTHNEVDANFTNLNNDKLDTSGIALGSAASPTIKFTGDINTGIYSPGADQLAVSTGGTGRLFVDASGFVGIGTTSPSSGLHLTNATAGSSANFTLSNPANNWSIRTGTTDNALVFVENQFSSEKVRITSAGNVGIGTSSPAATLQVLAGAVAGLQIGYNGLSANYYDANEQIFRTNDGTERLRINSTNALQIAEAGNIQVGTTTGTKIGTATTQKIGFFNKAPVVQPTAVADATDAATAITQLNALLARMRDLGLIAT